MLQNYETINKIAIIIQIFLLILFIFFSIGMVFSRGVCCGDDAYHSVVAKNLANGKGYSSTIQEAKNQYKLTFFDTRLGVGPTIILPAAVMIKLFGNHYWVPGLTEVIIWGILLIFIGIILNKFVKIKFELTIAIITFFYFSYTFMVYHFEQWFALLGEIPAGLLIILSVLVYFHKQSKANQIITGMLFSLAVQAKLVSFLPFLTFIFFLIINQYVEKKHNQKIALKKYIFSSLLIVFGFFSPLFIIETWKLISLGFSKYILNWSNYISNITGKGISINQDLIPQIIQRIFLLYDRFGIILPVLLLVIVIIGFCIKKDKKLFVIYSVFFSMTIIYTFYWLILSVGWARYYIIALIFIIFIFIFPLISTKLSGYKKVIFIISLVIISLINIDRINIFYPFQNVNLFIPSTSTLALEEISYLALTQLEKKPFVTQWWATAADIEYILSSNTNFTTYMDPDIDLDQPFIIIVNSKFLINSDLTFLNLLEKCDTTIIDQYIYSVCDNNTNH